MRSHRSRRAAASVTTGRRSICRTRKDFDRPGRANECIIRNEIIGADVVGVHVAESGKLVGEGALFEVREQVHQPRTRHAIARRSGAAVSRRR